MLDTHRFTRISRSEISLISYPPYLCKPLEYSFEKNSKKPLTIPSSPTYNTIKQHGQTKLTVLKK